MTPIFFADQLDFRKWLEENHDKEKEVLVGFYKVHTKKPSMTWSESVDQALCYGWIDGVRKSIDGDSYTIRFTPRKANSIWSAVNIRKVDELTKKGLMRPEGILAFQKRTEGRSKVYSFENAPVNFDEHIEQRFKSNTKAWEFFNKQAPSYRKTITHWVMRAKQEATRFKRLETVITSSEAGKKLTW